LSFGLQGFVKRGAADSGAKAVAGQRGRAGSRIESVTPGE
jgi:hypothetical protein